MTAEANDNKDAAPLYLCEAVGFAALNELALQIGPTTLQTAIVGKDPLELAHAIGGRLLRDFEIA